MASGKWQVLPGEWRVLGGECFCKLLSDRNIQLLNFLLEMCGRRPDGEVEKVYWKCVGLGL